MDKIDVSVIIPVYNASLLLNRCLDSVFAQNTQFSIEIILIDDGSTDNSVELIKSRKEKNILLLQQANSGPAAARNKGINSARGEYCTFLDSDDYWLPDYIEESVRFIKTDKELVAVNVAQRHIASNLTEEDSPKYIHEINHKTEPFVLDDFYEFWARYSHVGTCSTTMRTEIVKEIQGQRSDLRVTEDWEFWFYLATFGKWGFIPKVLYVSDGGVITRNMGWVSKMRMRWDNAPSVESWETRIISRFDQPYSNGYLKSRGIIARNLAYSQILSGREKLARQTILDYQKFLPTDRFSTLMKNLAQSPLLWIVLCKALKYRELNRKV